MSNHVAGISLKSLEVPINEALKAYEDIGDGLLFDVDGASQLEATTDKPNSARSATDVIIGDLVAKMYVIAFKPGDGSGDESARELRHLGIRGYYPLSTKIVPRDKVGIHTELHLNVLSQPIDDVHGEPELFRGSFDLLSIVGGHMIAKVGLLGDPARDLQNPEGPTATLTVGYDADGQRFGDPHAVYNSNPETLQVCAFIAITDAMQTQAPDLASKILNAQPPKSVQVY